MSDTHGVLYIVATPIGNLGDMTQRAQQVLESVALICAEDTRNSRKLLTHFGIHTGMMSLHEHNERDRSDEILQKLASGQSIALISDAGTPLISDPGYQLVSRAQQQGFQVVPIPGASAIVAALSVAGIATDRFCFEGFLPAKVSARRRMLADLADEARTLVFYEAPHRLVESLQDMRQAFGPQREACLAREITKLHETVVRSTLIELQHWVASDPQQLKGECVLVVAGAPARSTGTKIEIDTDELLQGLLARLSVRDAAQLCANLTGQKKNALYERALQLQQND